MFVGSDKLPVLIDNIDLGGVHMRLGEGLQPGFPLEMEVWFGSKRIVCLVIEAKHLKLMYEAIGSLAERFEEIP